MIIEVEFESDLDDQIISPPAVAYVREKGEFYLRHSPTYWGGTGDEADRWIRLQYSGGRSLILASDIAEVTSNAVTALYTLLGQNPAKLNRKGLEKYSGSYYTILEQIITELRNSFFVEMNKSPQPDIQDGDIVVSSGSEPIFAQAVATLPALAQSGYTLNLLGTRAVKLGTPGIHIQRATPMTHFYSMHPERIGYVVLSQDLDEAATSVPCNIHPETLPKGNYGGGAQWGVNNTYTDGRPSLGVIAPENGPFNTSKCVYLEAPYSSVSMGMSYSGLTGGNVPSALGTVINLQKPCPLPLYQPGSAITIDHTNMFVPDPVSGFIWAPLGTYGGYMGQSSFAARVGAQGAEYLETGGPGGTPAGTEWLNVYRSWIYEVGKRQLSPLRGIKKGDYIMVEGRPELYTVAEVKANNLDNPSQLRISPPLRYKVDSGGQTSTGVWISEHKIIRIDGFDRGGLTATFLGWPFPSGRVRIPIMVKGLTSNRLKLWAPTGVTIPAGTRMDIYASSDLDTMTFCYYDESEFRYRVELYNQTTFKLGKTELGLKHLQAGQLLEELDKDEDLAREQAGAFWFTPPYYVNKSLNEFLPAAKYGAFGTTFFDVKVEISRRAAILQELFDAGIPSYQQREYISLLNYGRM